jgi:membrane protein implicated in regulation of membrane protease activity
MHAWAWLAIAGVCAVIEILNLSLVFASFAIGAIVAGIAEILGANTPVQWILLAIATVLSLRLKPIATKYIFRTTPKLDTGINALIGQKALATSEITDSKGTINLRSETWTARTEGGEIAKGLEVTVLRIDGAVAIVAPRVESAPN